MITSFLELMLAMFMCYIFLFVLVDRICNCVERCVLTKTFMIFEKLAMQNGVTAQQMINMMKTFSKESS